MRNRDFHWTTMCELEFISSLGTHSEMTKLVPKRMLWLKYLKAAETRSNWDGMDKDKIIGFVKSKIAEPI